jgi:hypothetical protein
MKANQITGAKVAGACGFMRLVLSWFPSSLSGADRPRRSVPALDVSRRIMKTGKIFVFVSVIIATTMVLNGCSPAESGMKLGLASGKPYVDYQDLYDRGAPTDGFLMAGFELKQDNTIVLHFNTHGKPEDKKLIEPTIKKAVYLTQNLRKQHPIRLVFIDGNPRMTLDGKPIGTGAIIREVTLPVEQ